MPFYQSSLAERCGRAPKDFFDDQVDDCTHAWKTGGASANVRRRSRLTTASISTWAWHCTSLRDEGLGGEAVSQREKHS